jgi:hypothetical protein
MLKHFVVMCSIFMLQNIYGSPKIEHIRSSTHEKITVVEGFLKVSYDSSTYKHRYLLQTTDKYYVLSVPRHFVAVARASRNKYVEVRGVVIVRGGKRLLRVKNLVPKYKKDN